MKMWRFQNLLILLCTAFSRLPQTASVIQVFGYEGRDVKISCSYSWWFTSTEKYFCKEDCGYKDVLITAKQQRKNRYSISDDENKRIFTVTISDLKLDDTGTYWCGVSKEGPDRYTEVKLKVIKDSCCDKVTQIQGDEGGSVSIRCPYESKKKNVLKYVCRGKQPSTCLQRALITSDRQTKRFRFTDDRKSRTFTITIYNLTLEDFGSYLCGVQSDSGLDDFSAVELEVKEFCRVKSSIIRGIVGRPVTFQCSHPPQLRDKEKFFCKGDQLNNCTDMMANPTKFRLHQLSSSCFSVTITELEAGDAGRYYCGPDSQRSFTDYTRIQLEVDVPLIYILPTVLVLLLILTLVLLMFLRKKSKKLQVGDVMKSVGRDAETRINDIYDLHEDFEPSPLDTPNHDPNLIYSEIND
nr:polymeric immunoglobulin receptor-like isoform X3 [Nothobranchius furzeri]